MRFRSRRRLGAGIALAFCAAAAAPAGAQVLNPNTCPGGTLYSSTDPGADSGFSTQRDIVQHDCQGNMAGGAGSQAGIDLSSANTALGRDSSASGGQATALGRGSTAMGVSAAAVGANSNATGSAATSMGSNSSATAN